MATSKLRCDFCGNLGARVQRATRVYGRGAGDFLVRNIPTIRCSHCDESYVTAVTLHELERIKTHHGRLAVKRRVAVAEFPTATNRRASRSKASFVGSSSITQQRLSRSCGIACLC